MVSIIVIAIEPTGIVDAFWFVQPRVRVFFLRQIGFSIDPELVFWDTPMLAYRAYPILAYICFAPRGCV